MLQDIKIVLSMVLNFIYSLSILGIVTFYSLMGTVAMDRLCIIITEATGFPREEKMFSAVLSPIVIQNLFWLSIAGGGFCLLFIYLLHKNFVIFWGPATLSLMLFVLLLITRIMIINFLPADLDLVPTTPYILNVLDRFHIANISVLVLGIILCFLAALGDRYFIKQE
ncbi:MAG: hypothetical protein D5R97_06260 [Candidatus Syntrophonatronum acetioxidans]|uniref:Uncharacterized protein n=1 Tax=Candidatus Syntrophonatronum acetioxidans TaxID=1795816 RepID=A0A424YD64_9FIRM|nr:MAG: hypothetical protein D5R97_06260 [Candidatus Syntrophonatronum acetioxidans]